MLDKLKKEKKTSSNTNENLLYLEIDDVREQRVKENKQKEAGSRVIIIDL
jgi:hypothetical protein